MKHIRIISVIALLLLVALAAVEPIENVVVREYGQQFPCKDYESPMQCALRALHTTLGEPTVLSLS